jgi:HEPN domain-containing protein
LPADYESAAIRHFEDALALRKRGRIDNAGHLIGFAAECAIKYRIISLRPSETSPHGHFPELLVAARKHLGPRSGYTGMYSIVRADIFSGWHVNSRYNETGHTAEADLERWIQTTKRLFAVARVRVSK